MRKQCLHCKQIKDTSKFRRDKRNDDGYLIWCKECKEKYPKEYSREFSVKYYQEHQEKILNHCRAYYQEHRESISEKAREPLNRAKRRKNWEKYYAGNREQILAQDKEYRRKNKDKIRARQKRYRQVHKEEIQQKSHERYLRRRHTPEYRLTKKICDNRYRARLENCEVNDFTADQAKFLLEKSTRCPICGERFLKDDKRALDHIVPLSKGGNNTLLNIRVSHFSCNVKKGNRHYANYGDHQLLLIPSFQESPFKKPEPIILTEKKCFHCGIIKPISMFREDKARRDGHFGVCKHCMKIYLRIYRKEYFAISENRLRKNEQQQRWHQEHYLKDPEHWKKLYYKDRENKLIYAKKYREKHPEYFQEYGRKYYRKNRVHCIQVSRAWAIKHEEKVQEYGKRWRAEHSDYMKDYYQAQKTFVFTKILSSKLPAPSSQSPTPESKPQNEITIFFS